MTGVALALALVLASYLFTYTCRFLVVTIVPAGAYACIHVNQALGIAKNHVSPG